MLNIHIFVGLLLFSLEEQKKSDDDDDDSNKAKKIWC